MMTIAGAPGGSKNGRMDIAFQWKKDLLRKRVSQDWFNEATGIWVDFIYDSEGVGFPV